MVNQLPSSTVATVTEYLKQVSQKFKISCCAVWGEASVAVSSRVGRCSVLMWKKSWKG